MYKFHTKVFADYGESKGLCSYPNNGPTVDEWLNSFASHGRSQEEYNYNIVGYSATDHRLIVTIKVFEQIK